MNVEDLHLTHYQARVLRCCAIQGRYVSVGQPRPSLNDLVQRDVLTLQVVHNERDRQLGFDTAERFVYRTTPEAAMSDGLEVLWRLSLAPET